MVSTLFSIQQHMKGAMKMDFNLERWQAETSTGISRKNLFNFMHNLVTQNPELTLINWKESTRDTERSRFNSVSLPVQDHVNCVDTNSKESDDSLSLESGEEDDALANNSRSFPQKPRSYSDSIINDLCTSPPIMDCLDNFLLDSFDKETFTDFIDHFVKEPIQMKEDSPNLLMQTQLLPIQDGNIPHEQSVITHAEKILQTELHSIPTTSEAEEFLLQSSLPDQHGSQPTSTIHEKQGHIGMEPVTKGCRKSTRSRGAKKIKGKKKPNDKPAKKHSKERENPNNCIHLYDFLDDLLVKGNVDVLAWTSIERREFRVIDTKKIAKLWGKVKNNTNMTYDKMARALRYYNKQEIVRKIENKRLHFRFGESRVWKKT